MEQASVQTPSWDLEGLLNVLSKLQPQDLVRFLRPTYPEEPLDSWARSDLLELSLSLMQSWEPSSSSPASFLIQASANLCRCSFEAFVRLFWYDVPTAQVLKWNWHMSFLCNEIQTVVDRICNNEPKEYDEVINISPASSKSSITSILLPMWLWARMPSSRIISASGTDRLATDLATKSRTAMKGRNYSLIFPEIVFSEEQDSKGHFRNTLGGERLVSTVGGVSPIGFHAHLIVVDDPSDPERVRSEANRDAVRRFFTEVIRFRKVDISVTPLFLVMQRLEWDDATHVVLKEAEKEGAFPVKHVCLPAELTDDVSPPELRKFYTDYNEDAGCFPEGLMDPIRLSKRVLAEARTNRWVYLSQYLQRPVPPGGDMFKLEYFQTRASAPLACRRVRIWDRACLVAGTSIKTKVVNFPIEVDLPIEKVRAGDLVLTRQGYKKVKWSGVTKRVSEVATVTFSNGSELTGTLDHKVYTTESGWVPLSDLVKKEDPHCCVGLDRFATSEIYPKTIIRLRSDETMSVYDLEVEDAHEFFANGVLVHNSTPDGGCYTAGVLMGVDSERSIYVEDCVHGQWGPVERNRVMLATAVKDRNRYGKYEPVIWVEREPGSSGRDAFLGIVRCLSGFTVRELDVSRMGSKDTRAEPWAAQLSAMNVWLIDNGEKDGVGRAGWDIAGFVDEHTRFRPDPTTRKRTGGYCDRVDASSEGYAILFKFTRVNDPLRTYQLFRKANQGRWLIACSVDELPLLDIDEQQRVLVVLFTDPDTGAEKPIVEEGQGAGKNLLSPSVGDRVGGVVATATANFVGDQDQPLVLPRHIASLEISCVDLDPADYQVNYGRPIDPWGKPVTDLQLSRDQARKFWSHTLKKYDLPWQVLIIVDQGGEDRRALSTAMAVADMLRIPRTAIFQPGEENKDSLVDEDPPNRWVFDSIKMGKSMVVA